MESSEILEMHRSGRGAETIAQRICNIGSAEWDSTLAAVKSVIESNLKESAEIGIARIVAYLGEHPVVSAVQLVRTYIGNLEAQIAQTEADKAVITASVAPLIVPEGDSPQEQIRNEAALKAEDQQPGEPAEPATPPAEVAPKGKK